MQDTTFDALAVELIGRIGREHPGCKVFFAVFPPGCFDGQCGPHHATTLPAGLDVAALRSLANSIERNRAAETLIKVKL
jgi:hypothetical protein